MPKRCDGTISLVNVASGDKTWMLKPFGSRWPIIVSMSPPSMAPKYALAKAPISRMKTPASGGSGTEFASKSARSTRLIRSRQLFVSIGLAPVLRELRLVSLDSAAYLFALSAG